MQLETHRMAANVRHDSRVHLIAPVFTSGGFWQARHKTSEA
jgi:hypothetical protein